MPGLVGCGAADVLVLELVVVLELEDDVELALELELEEVELLELEVLVPESEVEVEVDVGVDDVVVDELVSVLLGVEVVEVVDEEDVGAQVSLSDCTAPVIGRRRLEIGVPGGTLT